ncbi:hypothetical protein HMPREF0731_0464 [Pseudoroseomonas cervicalis ATCC 49957]|uniref:Uncharacterized protein n=1 Tax=Pseudoroseomonas cervicalis ATCC 49957 TaxID=525371 RepID=D5RHA5_9PROT|nr:hypothetical protein HMPREF0731_0464 [Pseudoroseomonas cervicalis ATCC 49957]
MSRADAALPPSLSRRPQVARPWPGAGWALRGGREAWPSASGARHRKKSGSACLCAALRP